MNVGDFLEKLREFDRRPNKNLPLYYLQDAVGMVADMLITDQFYTQFLLNHGVRRKKQREAAEVKKLQPKVKREVEMIRLEPNESLTHEQSEKVLKGRARVTVL